MPTYDYLCNVCGHEFELFQSMSAPVKRKCPACGKSSLERLIGTGAGVIFKGSGFYETDYRSEKYKKAAEAETKNGSSETASASSSSSEKSGDATAKENRPAAESSSSSPSSSSGASERPADNSAASPTRAERKKK